GRAWFVGEESLVEHIKINSPELYEKFLLRKEIAAREEILKAHDLPIESSEGVESAVELRAGALGGPIYHSPLEARTFKRASRKNIPSGVLAKNVSSVVTPYLTKLSIPVISHPSTANKVGA